VKNHFIRADLAIILTFVTLASGCGYFNSEPLMTPHHFPEEFSRRYGHFTANLTGAVREDVSGARFRLNGGDWQPLPEGGKRISENQFTLEIPVEVLRPRPEVNRLEIQAENFWKNGVSSHDFYYNPDPVDLSRLVDWASTDLVAEDGYWEVVSQGSAEARVRPKSGFEGYDRILIVTGASGAGRRIETDLIYRGTSAKGGHEYGFGILPLWGGRPDDPGITPKRGWNFSLAWYWIRYKGAGNEFSFKYGSEKPAWVNGYRNIPLVEDGKYRLIVEVWPVVDVNGNHLRYTQRMKWWPNGDKEPAHWQQLSDVEGAPLPPGEYGVALICYRTQVEYGPVRITPLPARIAESEVSGNGTDLPPHLP